MVNMNPGKIPIQELNSSSGLGKIQAFIQTYQYYLQMIRDVTGLMKLEMEALKIKIH
jgi:hypothetical protein